MLNINIKYFNLCFKFGYLRDIPGHILMRKNPIMLLLRVVRLKEAIYLSIHIMGMVFKLEIFFII